MFTLMKESIRKSIDPNFFIKFCGLDENMQQVSKIQLRCIDTRCILVHRLSSYQIKDAQEFSQLFLSKLQARLSEVKHQGKCVTDLFGGNCSYITEHVSTSI
jgi:hypothetical protein